MSTCESNRLDQSRDTINHVTYHDYTHSLSTRTHTMLYAHTLMLVAPVDGAVQQVSQLYASVLRKALEMTYQNGTLDILTLVAPTNAFEAEKLLQQFYGLAVEEAAKLGRQSIDVRVLLDGENVKLDRQQAWEVLVAGKFGEYERAGPGEEADEVSSARFCE